MVLCSTDSCEERKFFVLLLHSSIECVPVLNTITRPTQNVDPITRCRKDENNNSSRFKINII